MISGDLLKLFLTELGILSVSAVPINCFKIVDASPQPQPESRCADLPAVGDLSDQPSDDLGSEYSRVKLRTELGHTESELMMIETK